MTSSLRIRASRQHGVTLTELMVALVLGALVVLAATSMVVTSRGTYRTQDESTRLAETARVALELNNRLVRLAGYTNFGNPNSLSSETPPAYYAPDPVWPTVPDAYSLDGPNVVGANNSRPGGATGLNGSDSLTIRFFGSNDPTTGLPDGNIFDCAGYPTPEPKVVASAANLEPAYRQARAYNVLFVDTDVDGEPALRCTRQTFDATGAPSGMDTQTLVRGVESFQVLYGEYIQKPSPNDDLDLNDPLSIVYRTGIGGPNPVGKWENVRTVRIAMLLRTATGTRPDPEQAANTYALFGSNYPWGADTGSTFSLASLSATERTRVRRVVQTTVFIRNRMSDWKSVFVN